MKIIFLLIFIFSSLPTFAYVNSKSESGSNIKWRLSSDELVIHVDPRPVGTMAVGVTSSSVMTIFNESLKQWDDHTPFNLEVIYSTSLSAAKNTVRFTSEPSYFGSGVLALTEINYNIDTGFIFSADILINESAYNQILFTDDEARSSELEAYLGDVFTHELGHFLGLSHTEVPHASMVYSVFKNQHTIHSDDAAGVMELYEYQQESTGVMSGKIVGGDHSAVFGAHVLLISVNSGNVVQSKLSDEAGRFSFNNLPLDDSYYFYVTPIKQVSTLPSFYSTAVSSYCSKGSYVGSFYTKCGPRSKGKPQGFYLSTEDTSIDVGEVSIRCDEDLDPSYLLTKIDTTNNQFELNPTLDKLSQVFVGMFSEAETLAGLTGNGDEFTLDLRSVNLSGINPATLTLKLDVISSGIGSAFDFVIDIKRADEANFTRYQSVRDETGKIITDQQILLDLSTQSNNFFTFRLYPISLSSSEKYEIFSSASSLSNNINQYVISSQVGAYASSKFFPLEVYSSGSYDDNYLCNQALVGYESTAYVPLGTGSRGAKLDPDDPSIAGISCATITIDDQNGPGGGMSFLVGLILVFAMGVLRAKSHKPF